MSLAAKDQFESLVTAAFASPHPVHHALLNTLAIMMYRNCWILLGDFDLKIFGSIDDKLVDVLVDVSKDF